MLLILFKVSRLRKEDKVSVVSQHLGSQFRGCMDVDGVFRASYSHFRIMALYP